MANDAQMPERIWYHPDGAYLSCQPAEHEGWQEFVLSDLCASGQQARALIEALRELTKQGRKTWNLGAQTGSHWVHLGAAVSKAERLLAALTPAPQPAGEAVVDALTKAKTILAAVGAHSGGMDYSRIVTAVGRIDAALRALKGGEA